MRHEAASLVIGSLEARSPSQEELNFLAKENVCGFILFKRNLAQEAQDNLRTHLLKPVYQIKPNSLPWLIAIDQEGGRVSRFGPPFPNEGPAMDAARNLSSSAQQAYLFEYGIRVGRRLLDLGINVNLAPVVDVLSNPLNQGIGDRAFGVRPDDVILRAGAFLRGMQSTGLLGCLKHFPGQGYEFGDPHFESIIIDVAEEELRKREWIPYYHLHPLAELVLVSHAIYPALDEHPASLSPKIVTRLLKAELGFQGLVLSDDMNMHAIPQDLRAWKEALVQSVAAGVDALLVCSHLESWKQAIEALETEAKRSFAFAERVSEAAQKVYEFRKHKLRTFHN